MQQDTDRACAPSSMRGEDTFQASWSSETRTFDGSPAGSERTECIASSDHSSEWLRRRSYSGLIVAADGVDVDLQ